MANADVLVSRFAKHGVELAGSYEHVGRFFPMVKGRGSAMRVAIAISPAAVEDFSTPAA